MLIQKSKEKKESNRQTNRQNHRRKDTFDTKQLLQVSFREVRKRGRERRIRANSKQPNCWPRLKIA